MAMQSKSAAPSFQEFFESVSSYCERHPVISKELVCAKEEFFFQTGKLQEGGQDFDNRINAFLLWFLFDRKWERSLRPPLSYYEEHLKKEGNVAAVNLLERQISHIHSLFRLIRFKKGRSLIQDMVTREKYWIDDEGVLSGVEKGIYFETRLFRVSGTRCLANYLIPHPKTVKSEIGKRLKRIGGDKQALKKFCLELHSYYTKWQTYRNISIQNIYRFGKSVPVLLFCV